MSHFEDTMILRDFSNSGNSSEWELSESKLKFIRDAFLSNHTFLFYANGNCEKNKGYVSIICSEAFWVGLISHDCFKEVEVRYFFSVVDVLGNKRFTQSIVIIPGMTEFPDSTRGSSGNFLFGLEKYLKREILFNDPAELLPGDCLTIYIEIDNISLSPYLDDFLVLNRSILTPEFQALDYADPTIKYNCMIRFSFFIDKCGRLCIPLDTFYGRKLCSLSGFFQRAADTTLTEDRTRRNVHIPEEEVVAFNNIFNFLFKPFRELYVMSIDYICQLYAIADKYDFQSVIEACRQLIKAFLCPTDDLEVRKHATQSVPDIIELADEYSDSDLKDAAETYQESIDIFETDDYALGRYLKEKLFTEWKCESRVVGRNLSGNIYEFKLIRMTEPEIEFYQQYK